MSPWRPVNISGGWWQMSENLCDQQVSIPAWRPKLVDFDSLCLYYDCLRFIFIKFSLYGVVLRSTAFWVFYDKSEPCNLTSIRSAG